MVRRTGGPLATVGRTIYSTWQEWKAVERRATKGQGAVRLEVLHLHGKVIQQATPKAAAAAARSRTAYLRSVSHGLGGVRGLQ